MPAVGEVRIRVTVPDPPTTKVELRLAVRPADGLTVRVTVPLNPSRDVIVMVDVVDCVASTELVEDAIREKS